jgi:branched-chain amino acid transport system permease protein
VRLGRGLLGRLGPRTQRVVLTAGGIGLLLSAWALASSVWPGSAPAGVVLLGVIFGTVTGLLAMGLVLIYRTNNIINFAYGAMGGVAGVLAVNLFLEARWPYFLAMATGLATGLVVGGLVEWAVIRRFADASRLILTVVTIGLALFLGGIEFLIPSIWGGSVFIGGFETPITFTLEVSPILLTGDHLLIMASVPPVLALMAWFLLRTDVGIAVRAAADNAERAKLYGIPINRLSTVVWVVAGGVAALTFILQAPFAGSVTTAASGVPLLLPALAAALVAGMSSLPGAFFAGVGLGILQQLVLWNTDAASAMDVAFLAVILLALLAPRRMVPRAREAGGTWSLTGVVRPVPRELRHLPEIRYTKWAAGAVVAAAGLTLPHLVGPATVRLMSVALVWGMVAVSLVILTGWGGNISLGQFAFVGVGAITFGNLITRYELDLFVMLLAAGAGGGLIALLVGIPALRIQGLFLAGTTLAFAVALDTFFLNPTNFPDFIPGTIPRPLLWDRFDLQSEWVLYYLCLAFLALTLLIARGVRMARSGRVLISTRDNYRASGAAAVPTTASRLTGFVLSGVVAGIAGGLFIVVVRGAGVGSFGPNMSIEVFSWAVIGGLGSVGGALFGVFTFRSLSQILSGELRLLLPGLGVVVMLWMFPGGLAQIFYDGRDNVLRWLAQRRGILVPSLLEDKRVAEEEQSVLEELEESEEEDRFAAVLGKMHAPTGGER